jgi:hypothetical protein
MVARAVPDRSGDPLLHVSFFGNDQFESPPAIRFPIGASSKTS